MRGLAVLILALSGGPALADACVTVKAAFDRLGAAPAYRQAVAMTGTPTLRMVAIGDILYMDDGSGAWQKLPLAPGMRAQMMSSALPDAAALQDCVEVGVETLDGAEMTVFTYTPPPVGGMAQGQQKLWVGVEDGLPRRMTAEQDGTAIDMTIDYEDVTAPIE